MEFWHIRSLAMSSRAPAGMSKMLQYLPFAALALVWGLATSLLAWSGPLQKQTQSEVTHLLTYLDRSGCEFFRNGTWHDAHQARDHLEMKYTYLLKKDLVHSADDFIAGAATASSMSGQAYQVRCGDGAAVPSAAWLRAELSRFRKAKHPAEK
jgi:Family of unknown function (DUF5329)